jgi:hypothetical protein
MEVYSGGARPVGRRLLCLRQEHLGCDPSTSLLRAEARAARLARPQVLRRPRGELRHRAAGSVIACPEKELAAALADAEGGWWLVERSLNGRRRVFFLRLA